jgi:predicted nucleic acid-binding Zn ribbon protein
MGAREEPMAIDGLPGFLAAVAAGRRALPRRLRDTSSRLGEVLERVVGPLEAAQERTAQIESQWVEAVPSHVAAHCRIQGVDGGQLHVAVDSPVYAYELRMCSREVVGRLQRRCPRLGLRTIKVTVA